jgi:hypothetical protein
MASKGNWTVVFEDKAIIKNYAEGASEGIGYIIDDNDTFWSESKFSNIWAIQYGNSVTSDEVEYRDDTPNSSYADANLGDISQFTDKWDAKHLAELQAIWDDDNVEGETESEKVTRLGARPTTYSS